MQMREKKREWKSALTEQGSEREEPAATVTEPVLAAAGKGLNQGKYTVKGAVGKIQGYCKKHGSPIERTCSSYKYTLMGSLKGNEGKIDG